MESVERNGEEWNTTEERFEGQTERQTHTYVILHFLTDGEILDLGSVDESNSPTDFDVTFSFFSLYSRSTSNFHSRL